MAVQDFERPLRRSRLQAGIDWEFGISVILLVAVVTFLGYTVLNLPRPANDFPLATRQLSELPR
jgi:hypothetical protein